MAQFEKAFQGYFSLLPNKYKKQDSQPDQTGEISFTLEEAMKFAEWLMAQPGEQNYKGDTVVKVPVVGWNKTSQKNTDYKFISGFCSALKSESQINTSQPNNNVPY